MGNKVEIEIKEYADGRIDVGSILEQIEAAAGGRFRVTDWVDVDMLKDDYDGISDDQALCALLNLSTGDYDDAINRDIRRQVIDAAVEVSDFDIYGDKAAEVDGDDETAEEENGEDSAFKLR